jgi:hypothetical protein
MRAARRIAGAVLGVIALATVVAPSCATSSTPVSSGGGGAAVMVAHPWARHGGTWVLDPKGWAWVSAAASAAALGALAEGNLGKGGVTSGYSNTGQVPFADVSTCHDPDTPGWWQLERWLSVHYRLHLDCAQMHRIWRLWKPRNAKGQDVMRCITWILARGDGNITMANDTAIAHWSWGGGRVNAVRTNVSQQQWRIVSAKPAKGSWKECAKG